MIAKSGFLLLILIVAISGFSAFLALFNHKNRPTLQILAKLNFTLFIVALLCKLCLIYSFLISDYSVLNVYQNSHHLKPTIFKIAASWGNHEGSMLLLILVLIFYNLIFIAYQKTSINIAIATIGIQNAIITLFAFYTLSTSNPFLPIFPVPQSGLGLNPILQDIGLALHPPMLYCGYLGSILLFSLTMAMLINQDFNRRNLQHLRILLYFSFSTLSLGIGLGSWWAYRELGWGGYWFWDPVENISLMPWLALVMLLHCLILAQKNYHFKVWLIFLTITNVILCLLGIFLTRSGVLTSVHSFAVDLKRGFAMVAIVFAVGVFGFALFASKIATINKTINTQPHQQQHLLIWQNYLLLISLLVVFIGTIYPILAQGLWHELVSIGPEYYQQIFAVLILPFLLLIAIAHKINFSKLFQYVVVFIVAITSFFVAYFSQSSKISTWLIFFLVQFAFVNNLFSQQKIATKIAHCGFLLIIAGVATNGYFAKTKELNMQLNQSTEIAGFNIKFEQVKYISGSNFISQQGMFSISKNNNLLATTSPELRYYPVSQQTTNETSIYHNWLANIAIVLGSKDEQQNYAVRIYYKPLIYLIWCGAFLLAVSFPINFFSQNINKILTNSKQQKS